MLRINNFQNRGILLACFIFIFIVNIKGQDFQFHGQISGWGTGTRTDSGWNKNLGLRYFPQLNYSYSIDEDNLINGEKYFLTLIIQQILSQMIII